MGMLNNNQATLIFKENRHGKQEHYKLAFKRTKYGWLNVGFLAKELGSRISGARVDRISQPYKDILICSLRIRAKILGCIAAGLACTRIHETQQSFKAKGSAYVSNAYA